MSTEEQVSLYQEETTNPEQPETVEKTPEEIQKEKEVAEATMQKAREDFFKISAEGNIEVPEDFLNAAGVRLTEGLSEKEIEQLRGKTIPFSMAFANGDNISLTLKLSSITRGGSNEYVESLEDEDRNWIFEAGTSFRTTTPDANENYNYGRINTREGAKWSNTFTSRNGKPMGIAKPNFRAINGNEVVSGKRAIDIFHAATGLGGRIAVPLYHTGIWVTLRTPTLSQLVEFDRMMAEEKIDLGRRTKGAIFGNETTFTQKRIVQLILSNMEETNAWTSNPDELMDIIRLQDLDTLMWASLCTHHPNGFNLSVPCLSDVDCNYVAEEIVNLRKMLFVDLSQINDEQIGILSRIGGNQKLTPADLEHYQNQFSMPSSHRQPIPLTEDENGPVCYVTFRRPIMSEAFDIGQEWINRIEQTSVTAFPVGLSGRERNLYVDQQAKATILLRYAHFVDKIEIVDGENTAIIEERKDINEILSRLSGNALSRRIFDVLINAFINDSLVSVIGYPNYSCPKCGKAHATKNSPSRHIVPFDGLSTFFTHVRALINSQLN